MLHAPDVKLGLFSSVLVCIPLHQRVFPFLVQYSFTPSLGLFEKRHLNLYYFYLLQWTSFSCLLMLLLSLRRFLLCLFGLTIFARAVYEKDAHLSLARTYTHTHTFYLMILFSRVLLLYSVSGRLCLSSSTLDIRVCNQLHSLQMILTTKFISCSNIHIKRDIKWSVNKKVVISWPYLNGHLFHFTVSVCEWKCFFFLSTSVPFLLLPFSNDKHFMHFSYSFLWIITSHKWMAI